MTKSSPLDEATLRNLADSAYLHGRLASILPDGDPLRARMGALYLPESDRAPSETYCYLLGLLFPEEPLLDSAALLERVHATVCGPGRQQRRPRRPDTRWGVQ